MSSRKKIFFVGIIFSLLLVLSIVLFFVPKISIKINGDKNIILNLDDEYVEFGAQAFLKKGLTHKEIPVTIEGEINTHKNGKYIITYKASYKNIIKNDIRIVNVVDKEAPIITLKKKVVVCKNNNLVEIDASAIDNMDGDISDKIKYKIDKEKISIFAIDSSNNRAEIVENLEYSDNDKPEISLNGSNIVYIKLGTIYNEQGAKAYDTCDGNITDKIKIEGNVDVNIPGEYTIIYKVSDSLNNETSITRKVIVSEKEDERYQVTGEAIIYLTFDDGPGMYTEEILSILDKYNVKATFFVTNQFPKYQYLIGKEYSNGHTVGIHTYSHKWSIYDSVDTYLNDFNKILDIVISQTGLKPKYFRFPGGSSNTVSRSHSKGIMTKLSKLMQDNGYTYFDWTFDSCDTCKKNSVDDIIANVKRNLKGNGKYVILMHDIKKNTLKALPSVIEYAQTNGYTFKSIDDETPVCHFKIAN